MFVIYILKIISTQNPNVHWFFYIKKKLKLEYAFERIFFVYNVVITAKKCFLSLV